LGKCVYFLDCIKLLLEKHADPRVEDECGTTPLELAKDDMIRTLLHDAVIDADSKRDSVGMLYQLSILYSTM